MIDPTRMGTFLRDGLPPPSAPPDGGDGEPVPRVGRFELIERIGEGGMAVVYRALDPKLKRPVALKHIKADRVKPALLERFRREAVAAARLSHPGIVPVYEAEADYVVMELVEGETLHAAHRGLPLRRVVELVEQAARAVHHAHAHGVIHRDLKPGNIMIDREGRARVLDFGMARVEGEDASLTAPGTVVGTPQYMSPEQAEGAPWKIGPHTDVYGLGVTLYEAAAGRPPFEAPNVAKLYDEIRRAEPPAPRKLNGDIDAALETAILTAIDKDPGRRYASANDFADDLRRWLDGEAIRARPASLGARMWRAVRRAFHADDELRDAKALYESLVENLPQCVYRKDLHGRVTFGNRRYCAWLGKTVEELVGKTDFDLFPRELAEKYLADDRRVMETGAILDTEEQHVMPDGRKIFVQVVKTPLVNARGKLIGTQGIFWDITERRR